jgi:NitT/TauT family transport system permease protein
MRKARVSNPFLGFLSIMLLLSGWQLSAMHHLFAISGFPSPIEVTLRIIDLRGELAIELIHTLRRAAIGLILAVVSMIPLGVIIGRSRAIAQIVEPVVELLRPLPTPAIIPFMMLIAGIGDGAKIAVIFYASAFPILLNAIDGARALHPMLSLTARSLRLTRLESIAFIYVPASLPQVMAGIRTSVAISVLVSVTAEMLLSTDGLGIFLLRSQENFRLVDGIAGIVVLAAAAMSINWLYTLVDERLLRWHYHGVGARGDIK